MISDMAIENRSDNVYENIKNAIKEVLKEEDIGYLSKIAYYKLVSSCNYEIARTQKEYSHEDMKQLIRYELGLILSH